jgi:hypothetical protein
MVVVRHRPVLKLCLRLLVVVAFVVAVTGAYKTGFQRGADRQIILEKTLAETIKSLQPLETLNQELAQQLINARTGAEVDRKASETIRKDLSNLRSTLQKTQEENDFYRNIMSPDEGEKGPAIDDWEVKFDEQNQYFTFKLLVKQLAKHTDWVKGHVEIVIVGTENNLPKSYNYKDLAVIDSSEEKTQLKSETVALKVRFRYFQTLTGSFELPKTFTPQYVDISLIVGDKKTTTITNSYEWLTN